MSESPKRKRGRPKSLFTDGPPPLIQALDRGLMVLTELARMERAALTDLSHRLNMPAATLHRILATLERHEYAEIDDTNQMWMVGVEAFRTGSAYINRTDLMQVSRPIMRRLMEATGETANLAIPDGGEVVFVGQVETQNPIRAFFAQGTRTPMHASGIGKAILATMSVPERIARLGQVSMTAFTENTLSHPDALGHDLEATRTRGWSFDREERHAGMSCIGAVIRDETGMVVAGVSVSGPSSRFAEHRLPHLSGCVTQAASDITNAIGGAVTDA